MIFIETSVFTKLIYDYLSEDEYLGLQSYLLLRPDAGDVVPGSGGVRVIYYWKQSDDEIWMLTLYAKNEASNIPAHVLRRIAEELKNG